MSGWSSQRVAEVGELYDLLASTPPPGMNKYEMEAQPGWSPGVLHQRIRDLRIELGDDNINLVCDPDGHREAWRYFLTGNLGEAREWLNNRRQDLGEPSHHDALRVYGVGRCQHHGECAGSSGSEDRNHPPASDRGLGPDELRAHAAVQ